MPLFMGALFISPFFTQSSELQNMKNFTSFFISLVFSLLLISPVLSESNHDEFLQCLTLRLNDPNIISNVIHTQNDSSFSSVLISTIQNPRFLSPETPKPVLIITPVQPSHVQSTVICARKHDVHIKTRSGGHDYEGLSYVSATDFIILDLVNFGSITVDIVNRTAWVQTGATNGQLYHEIAKKDKTLAFPAGVCPTVGLGGHFSGGGYGTLMRKYGLAADHVVDAQIVDARGRLLDRQGMGEDFFWAIRGGGGSSFAVILSWKIRLVDVPMKVTVFNVTKTSEEEALTIIDRWQHIADKVSDEMFVRVMLQRSNETEVVRASFPSLYLGPIDDLLTLMENEFPELGLQKEDCTEMSWVESVLWYAEFPAGESLDVLSERTRATLSFKAKSDFVKAPIPRTAIRELWRRLYAPEAELAQLIFTPFGGRMSEIAESELPFPYRAGNIYEIQYLAYWRDEETEEKTEEFVRWVESVHEYMTPFVSKSPRGAYINLRDLDLGMYSSEGNRTRYEEGREWGVKYFKNNFERLVSVKTTVDPTDFFRDEQSIPTFGSVKDYLKKVTDE